MRAVMLMTVGAVLLPALTVVLGQIPGGINDISLELNDPVLIFAVEQLRNRLNLGNDVTLLSVTEAKSQVTDRVTYFLKLSLSRGYSCAIDIEDHRATPGLSVKGQPRCLVAVPLPMVLPRPTRTLGGVSSPKPLPGQDDPRNSHVLDALDAAVCAVNNQALGQKAFKISDASGVTYTTQVTAGITYRYYNVPLIETNCRQSVCDRNELASCDTQRLPKRKRCDFEVQHTPAPNPGFVVSPDKIRACVDLD